MHGVFDTSLLLLHFRLGRSAHLDHSYATDQFRQPLLQFLAVVVTGGFINLTANFLYATFDVRMLAFTFDDGGIVLVDGDLLGLAEILHLHVLKLDTEIFGDCLPPRERCDVLQHCLAPIAESRRLYGSNLPRAPQLVDHQGRQGFALDVLCDDEQRLAALGNLLKQRKDVLHGADLLFIDEDIGVLEGNFHAFGIRDEVRGEVAAVELHAFDHFELSLKRLRLFHGNDAVLADLLHCIRDDVADRLVIVGGDAANLGDHVTGDGLGQFIELAVGALPGLGIDIAANYVHSFLDAALHRHRISAGGDGLDAFTINGLGENSRSGGAIASDVAGLGGDLTHHLCAQVLEAILQFDLFRHGDAVLGNRRRTEFLFDDYI